MNWQFKLIITGILLLLAYPAFRVVMPEIQFEVEYPRVIAADGEGTLKIITKNRASSKVHVTVDFYGANAASKHFEMNHNTLEIPFQPIPGSPAVLYRAKIDSSRGDYTFYGRIDLKGGVKKNGLYLITDRLRYRPGDVVRIMGFDYSTEGLRQNSNFNLSIKDGRGNTMLQKDQKCKDGLLIYEFELSDRVNQGNWSVHLSNDKQAIFSEFTVKQFMPKKVALSFDVENGYFSKNKDGLVTVNVTHFAGGNVDGKNIKLFAYSESRKKWSDSQVVKDGKATFKIEQSFLNQSHELLLQALVGEGPGKEELQMTVPVYDYTQLLRAYPDKGYMLEGVKSKVVIEGVEEFIDDKGLKILEGGKELKLQEMFKNGQKLFFVEFINDGDDLTAELNGIEMKKWEVGLWYQKSASIRYLSVSKNELYAELEWNSDRYKTDSLKVSILKGEKEVVQEFIDVHDKSAAPFKLEGDYTSGDFVFEYALFRDGDVLYKSQKKIHKKFIDAKLDLSFDQKQTQPDGDANVVGRLNFESQGTAAVIVQDRALELSGKEEGFNLLKSELLTDEEDFKKNDFLVYRNSNMGQVEHLKKKEKVQLAGSFKALFIVAALSAFIAYLLVNRGRILTYALIVICLFIVAAMLLPALGKAREKTKGYESKDDAKDAAKEETLSKGKSAVKVRRNFKGNLLFTKVNYENGQFKLPVKFADNLTTWKAEAIAFSGARRPAYGSAEIVSTKDLFAKVHLPVFFVQGDQTEIDIEVFNKKKESAKLILSLPDEIEVENKEFEIPAGKERSSVKVPIHLISHGEFKIRITVSSENDIDIQELPVRVKSGGIPVTKTKPLNLFSDKVLETTVEEIPNAIVQNSYLSIYPGSLSENISGVENMFREPNGCFEQTSSSNFPNIVAYNYLKEHKPNSPMTKTMVGKLERGYQRLASFEVSGGGFSLYGNYPASPWLTSYGILQFSLMKKHIYVDEKIIERAWKYLKPKLNSMPKKERIFALYCARSAGLIDAGTLNEHRQFITGALKSKNLFTAVNASFFSKHDSSAVIEKVIRKEGYFESVNSGSGQSARVVVTALALQSAYENKLPYVGRLKKELLDLKKNGRWYGTMATALSLYAMTLTDDQGDKELAVSVNSKSKTYILNKGDSEVIYVPLKPGDRVSLKMIKGQYVSCQLHNQAEIRFGTSHEQASTLRSFIKINENVQIGEEVAVEVKLDMSETKMDNPMLELPLPAGFTLDKASVQHLVDEGKVRNYEMASGNTLVLYLRDYKKSAMETFTVNLYAKKKGIFRATPGRFYEYYKPEDASPVRIPRVMVR